MQLGSSESDRDAILCVAPHHFHEQSAECDAAKAVAWLRCGNNIVHTWQMHHEDVMHDHAMHHAWSFFHQRYLELRLTVRKCYSPMVPNVVTLSRDAWLHFLTFSPQDPTSHASNVKSTTMKVAVVGAGIAGMSAAYHISKHGGDDIEVTLIEKEDIIGGHEM